MPRTIPMEYVRAANRAEGGHFFDDDTMRFFDSRIESDVAFFNVQTEDAFFVTSEQPSPESLRTYKVRRMDQHCRIRTASDKPILDRQVAFKRAQELAQ